MMYAYGRDGNFKLYVLLPWWSKVYVKGIRTLAHRSRLRPERSALDHSAILTCYDGYIVKVNHSLTLDVHCNAPYGYQFLLLILLSLICLPVSLSPKNIR